MEPFQRTTDVLTKPVPLTVSVIPVPPAVALAGDRLLIAGVGLCLNSRSTRPVPNVAFTFVAELTVTAHVPVPEQGPLQPMKVEPETGVAVRVSDDPAVIVSEQVAPQLMPAGALVTVPEPVPSFVIDRVRGFGLVLNAAMTEVAAFTVTAQVPVPEQAPLQPAKEEPVVGLAVSVMAVPGVTDCEHVAPQLMPAGLPTTVPEPVPLLVTDSVTGAKLNVAVTDIAALTVTVQMPVPEQAPLQLAKDEPAAGVAVRVMAVPGVTGCEQVVPQSMPAGLLVTVPEPVPLLVTDSVIGRRLKVAVTDVAALTVTAQVPVPEQAPLHPAKDEPATGVAVRAMAVPGVTDCEQIAPQLMMPAGLPVTVPEPAPLFVTDSVTGTRLKVAVAVVAAFTVTAHVPVPEQAPLQPAKEEPAAGVAVRVMAVPGVTDCEQAVPQLMPAGLPVTVPEPVPLFVIDSVSGAAGGAGTRRGAQA